MKTHNERKVQSKREYSVAVGGKTKRNLLSMHSMYRVEIHELNIMNEINRKICTQKTDSQK